MRNKKKGQYFGVEKVSYLELRNDDGVITSEAGIVTHSLRFNTPTYKTIRRYQ